jgi:hypothetical protein
LIIVLDYTKISVVTDKTYHEEIKLLDPRITIPSRYRLTEVLLPQLRDEVVEQYVTPVLLKAKYVSVSFDLWMNCQHNDIFSLVVHALDSDHTLKSIFLGVACLNRTTAAVMTDAVYAMLEGRGLQKKISAFVTDAGANVLSASRMLGEKTECGNLKMAPMQGRCWAHAINLVLKKMVYPIATDYYEQKLGLNTFSWKKLKENLLAIVRWTKKSGKGAAAWTHACTKANMKKRKLYKPIPTRFGNLVMMFRQLLKYRSAVSLLIMDNPGELSGREPSSLDWTVVKEFVTLCEPIFKICMLNQNNVGWTITHALYSNMKCLEHLMSWKRGGAYMDNVNIPAEVRKFTKEMATVGYDVMKRDLDFLFQYSSAYDFYAFALIIDPRTRDLWMDLLDKEGGGFNPIPKYHEKLKGAMKTLRTEKYGNPEGTMEKSKYHNFAGETVFEGMEKEVANQLARFVEEKTLLSPEDSSSELFRWLNNIKDRFPEIVQIAEAVNTGSFADFLFFGSLDRS